MRAYLALPFLLSAAAALWPEPGSFVRAQSDVPPPGFTIAFIGDQGFNPFSWAVLELIKDEGADAVLHSGDFDYLDLPFLWEAQINEFLGKDFPYFTSVGNHDADKFRRFLGYQYFMEARLERLGIPWEGDLGVQSVVKYKGISFMLTAPGTFGPGDGFHDVYIQQKLAEDPSIWRISSWHKNMNQMQVGGKSDSTGWGVYEESRRGGAIIATAHEHSYSRSHLLSDMQNQSVASTANTLVVSRDDPNTPEDEGRSFVFVSGLGGQDIRDQERCLPFTPPYGCNGEWASIYTSDQGAAWGALFGVFNYQGDPRLAYFYFKDILGRVPDEFFVRSTIGAPPVCGDGTCDASEDCVSCATDCGACPPVCGDGTCDASETCLSCAADCGTCPPIGGACAGQCGGKSPQGCWCDESCAGFGDCCPDVCVDCSSLGHCP